MIAHRLGTLRYYQTLGQNYADMLRGGTSASAMVTGAAALLGMGKTGAVILGVGSLLLWPILAIGFGYAVWRWRVIHSTLESDWRNNPFHLRMTDLLEEIARNTRRPVIGTLTVNGEARPLHVGD